MLYEALLLFYVSYLRYMFITCLLYIYMYMICFLILLYISISTLFDFKYV